MNCGIGSFIIAREESAALPEEHRKLVREFPYGHFDHLMDSGVIQRAREIKQRFGDSFYHPRVLLQGDGS